MFGSLYEVHIDGHLGCFQFSPIRTKAALDIFAQASSWTHAFIFLGKQLGVEFLCHKVWCVFYYKKLPDFFQSDRTIPFYILHSHQQCESAACPLSSPIFLSVPFPYLLLGFCSAELNKESICFYLPGTPPSLTSP